MFTSQTRRCFEGWELTEHEARNHPVLLRHPCLMTATPLAPVVAQFHGAEDAKAVQTGSSLCASARMSRTGRIAWLHLNQLARTNAESVEKASDRSPSTAPIRGQDPPAALHRCDIPHQRT